MDLAFLSGTTLMEKLHQILKKKWFGVNFCPAICPEKVGYFKYRIYSCKGPSENRSDKGPCKRTQHCWAKHVASVCMEPQQCWHLLAFVAYSLKPVKLLGSYKRTQRCWPTTRNIVEPNMLRPFAWNHNNVGTCWLLLCIV